MNELTDGNVDSDDRRVSADTAPLPSDPKIKRIARGLVRIGWWTCIGGLPVTLWGAQLVSQGGKNPSTFAQGVHSAGLLIMLAGLATALLGYRTPWLLAPLPPAPERLRGARRDVRDPWGASDQPSTPQRPASSKLPHPDP